MLVEGVADTREKMLIIVLGGGQLAIGTRIPLHASRATLRWH